MGISTTTPFSIAIFAKLTRDVELTKFSELVWLISLPLFKGGSIRAIANDVA